ncbi:TPA: PhnA domain-containing protein [Legionella pneumophila]|nr:PhnA domain-containing protein [Legionella pneumophila]MCK1848692.1 PhnA domain-containing protein [Legionella pneumophila]MCZ4804096.1 PhnA domain-containing protein [Legionella pneumophila]MDI9852075.1 PhnA domain-containing protein [Legionella pneumophila]MDW8854746.1 PhnA domain-containing protein [Legionella pneumophila]MDW8866161.1 PhnA domain-containing protein [Legionella pneumophila]
MIKKIIIYPAIDCRIDGIGAMKLKSQFVKKI